jgi:hypothetical protein
MESWHNRVCWTRLGQGPNQLLILFLFFFFWLYYQVATPKKLVDWRIKIRDRLLL